MAKFDGTEGAVIELSQAANWTGNYRAGAAEEPGGTVVKAHFFGHQILQSILDQEGCMGIRIYYARDEEGRKKLVLIGADAAGNDMEDGVVADWSKICHPDCTTSGKLIG
ncbi:hypothetical protein ACSX1A_01510 [Pontibacter sp. MBLB2868]|uniref:hypothetical protein n=1 Tax=Pontibacter sp. MBLB2868 TaxID=3451555 RepID=UPI003F755607